MNSSIKTIFSSKNNLKNKNGELGSSLVMMIIYTVIAGILVAGAVWLMLRKFT